MNVVGAVVLAFGALPLLGFLAEDRPVVAVPLRCKEAIWAAEKLNALLGKDSDTLVLADRESNTVFIRGSAEQVEKARKALQRLEDEHAVLPWLNVITLERPSAPGAALALNVLLGGDDFKATAAEGTNSIILLSTAKKLGPGRQFLRWLDRKDR